MPSSASREHGTARSSRKSASALAWRCRRVPGRPRAGRLHAVVEVDRSVLRSRREDGELEQAPGRLVAQGRIGTVVLVGGGGVEEADPKIDEQEQADHRRRPRPAQAGDRHGNQGREREAGDRHQALRDARVPQPGQMPPERVVARQVRAQGEQHGNESAEPKREGQTPPALCEQHGQSREGDQLDGPAEVDEPLELLRLMAREEVA